jgi:hypothetical protein
MAELHKATRKNGQCSDIPKETQLRENKDSEHKIINMIN